MHSTSSNLQLVQGAPCSTTLHRTFLARQQAHAFEALLFAGLPEGLLNPAVEAFRLDWIWGFADGVFAILLGMVSALLCLRGGRETVTAQPKHEAFHTEHTKSVRCRELGTVIYLDPGGHESSNYSFGVHELSIAARAFFLLFPRLRIEIASHYCNPGGSPDLVRIVGIVSNKASSGEQLRSKYTCTFPLSSRYTGRVDAIVVA